MKLPSPRRSNWWRRAHRWFDHHPALRMTRKIVVGTLGVSFILAGVLTGPILPGPNFIVLVLLGLAMLASEFVWARLAIRKGEAAAHRTAKRFSGRRLKPMWRWKKWIRRRYGASEASGPGL